MGEREYGMCCGPASCLVHYEGYLTSSASPCNAGTKLYNINNMTAEKSAQIIDEMVNRIVLKFNPDKIILFGSYARGEAGYDSDVDLLVVMPVSGSRREMAVQIGLELYGTELPKDIVVTTPEEMEEYRNIVGTVIYPALREGKVLYERAA
jgi:predicted nucleotidyltransferase